MSRRDPHVKIGVPLVFTQDERLELDELAKRLQTELRTFDGGRPAQTVLQMFRLVKTAVARSHRVV